MRVSDPSDELTTVCRKFQLAKCVCDVWYKKKHLMQCTCGKYYCKRCESLSCRDSRPVTCIACKDKICAKCEADACIICDSWVCLKESNITCNVILCSCNGRICCYDKPELNCNRCNRTLCSSCMEDHPCKPTMQSCKHITYIGEPVYWCSCGVSACIYCRSNVEECLARHSMYGLLLAMGRLDLSLPPEIIDVIFCILTDVESS